MYLKPIYFYKFTGEPCIYDLYAVLIHRGPSAYSGHYIAHIQEQNTGIWYKFNDEEIEKMGGKGLHLGKEDDGSGELDYISRM